MTSSSYWSKIKCNLSVNKFYEAIRYSSVCVTPRMCTASDRRDVWKESFALFIILLHLHVAQFTRVDMWCLPLCKLFRHCAQVFLFSILRGLLATLLGISALESLRGEHAKWQLLHHGGSVVIHHLDAGREIDSKLFCVGVQLKSFSQHAV